MKCTPHWLKLPHHNCNLECPAKYSELRMQIMNVNKNSITIFRRMGVSLDSRCLCYRCSLSSLYKSQQEKDAADARAILEVMCSPDMMFVEIKAPAHQGVLLARQVRSTWWLSPLRRNRLPSVFAFDISDLIQLHTRDQLVNHQPNAAVVN